MAIVALGLALVWALSDDDTSEVDAAPRAQNADEPPPPVKPLGLNGARIAGTVLRDGKPVANARVTLRAAAPLVTLSMDDGRFLFEDVPSGQLYLSASNAEAASEVLGPLQVLPGTKLEELVLNLAPAVNIEGRVIDLMTQRPIAKATVITPARAGVTDDEGRFTVTGSKSQIWLDVSAPGFLTRTEWVSLELAQAGGKLEIVLTPSSRLEGKVTESGAPAVAATVWTELAEGGRRGERSLLVFTDKEGNFSLECGAGAMQLTAVTARGTRVRGPFIRVAVGEKKTGIVLDAADVSAAEGIVLLDGAPLPAAQITAIDAQTEELSGVATTTTEGKFRFESLALGKYVLQIRAMALTSTAGPFEHDGTGRTWQVNVQAGKALVGRVEPPSAGTIVRWRSGTWSGPSAQTVTDAEGKFRFEGLPSEIVSLDAEGPAGAATARARAGDEVVLVLKKSEVIVHLRDDKGGPVTDGVLSARSLETGTTRRQLVLAPDGITRLDLPLGRWELTLEVNGRGRSATVAIDVTAAGAQATLTLEASLSIFGKVTDKSTGLPLQGARIEAINGDFGRAFRVTVLSDGRGEFQLPPVPSSVMLRCDREGFNSAWTPAKNGPPWSFALDPAKPNQRTGAEPQQFEGVGMTLDGRTGNVIVSVVSEGSPAERAGVQVGDQIVVVDGMPVAGRSLNDVVNRIRGPAGTPVLIQFSRNGQPLELTLRRRLLTL